MTLSGVAGPVTKEILMKKLIALMAVAGLSGCVGYVPYGSAYYGNSPYYGAPDPYVVEQPTYIYGNGGSTRTPRYGRNRDRDRDGVPDRYDRDRDGDGVPNRRDAYPGDPRRY
jgi:hypothetical protein